MAYGVISLTSEKAMINVEAAAAALPRQRPHAEMSAKVRSLGASCIARTSLAAAV
jgi:hypothetical protein